MSDAKSACDETGGLVCGIESPLKKLGNIQTATITIQSAIEGAENKYNSSGLNPCSRVSFAGAALTVSLLCSKKKNMELALQSKSFVHSTGLGYTQEYTLCGSEAIELGNLFVFEKSGVDLLSASVRLLDVDNLAVATLVEGLDYTLSAHGIELLRDLPYPTAVYLRVIYDYDDEDFDEFNFLSEFKGAKYVYFKGTNSGEGIEEPLGVEIYKVFFTPVSQLDLISQGNYFVLNLTGQIEKSFDNEDLGLGGYFKLRR